MLTYSSFLLLCSNVLCFMILLFQGDYYFVHAAKECDACQFDGNDIDDCKDYGKIDNELIPWSLGTQTCKDTYNIKITSLNPDVICDSTSSFVNDLRFGSLSSSNVKLGLGIGAMPPGFFVENSNNNKQIELRSSITINGVTTNCEVSQGNCYNAMKPYFETDPNGMMEMDDVCMTLYSKVKVDRQLEESTLRIRLCMELRDGSSSSSTTTTIPTSCNPLLEEINIQTNVYRNKDCPAFGIGIGSTTIPGCEDNKNNNNLSKQTESNSYSIIPRYINVLLVIISGLVPLWIV